MAGFDITISVRVVEPSRPAVVSVRVARHELSLPKAIEFDQAKGVRKRGFGHFGTLSGQRRE